MVVGTRFRLYRSEDATRLELSEGNVQLERQINGRVVETVEIESGNAAVVSAEPVPVKITPLGTGRVQLYATLTATGHEVALAPSGDW